MSLPIDVWYLICEYIEDVSTLHSLAVASKTLEMAIPYLYDVQRLEASRRPWSEDSEQRLVKWAQFWRTIVLSTLPSGSAHATTHRYVNYLKVFDVLDLEWFLESIVKDKRAKSIFFTDHVVEQLQMKSKSYVIRDVPEIMNKIAALILPYCSAVEEISREPTNSFLDDRVIQFTQWLKFLPKLSILRVFDGTSLTTSVRQVLQDSCPRLNHFDIYLFKDVPNVDDHVHKFLEQVPRAWESCVLRTCTIGNKSLAALANASDSLKHLELWSFKTTEKLEWGILSKCSKLETIALIDFDMPHHLFDNWYQPFDEFFSGSFNLKTLHLEGVSCCLAYSVKQLLASQQLQVLRLRLDKDERLILPRDPREAVKVIELLSTGLATQNRLRDLDLIIAIPDDFATEFASHVVSALVQLQSLQNLQLGSSAGPTGYFTDDHIFAMSDNLQLESLKIASFTLTDRSMAALGNMKSLQVFESTLPSHVSGTGLLHMVKQCTSLETVLFVGNLNLSVVDEIEDILVARGGRFTNFEPYVPRNDYADDSDSVDGDYEP